MAAMWTSKLGKKYLKEEIEHCDNKHHRILEKLRRQPCNANCAECGEGGACWASVNLGVFVCLRCADVHRALGTHISKVKGCTGTYLWGPDEVEQMQRLGNAAAEARYGGGCGAARPERSASKDERVELCRKKYEQLLWARSARAKPAPALPHDSSSSVVARSTGDAGRRALAISARPADVGRASPAKCRSADVVVSDLDAFFANLDACADAALSDVPQRHFTKHGFPDESDGPREQATAAAVATASFDDFLGPSRLSQNDVAPTAVAGAESAAVSVGLEQAHAVWDDFGTW